MTRFEIKYTLIKDGEYPYIFEVTTVNEGSAIKVLTDQMNELELDFRIDELNELNEEST